MQKLFWKNTKEKLLTKPWIASNSVTVAIPKLKFSYHSLLLWRIFGEDNKGVISVNVLMLSIAESQSIASILTSARVKFSDQPNKEYFVLQVILVRIFAKFHKCSTIARVHKKNEWFSGLQLSRRDYAAKWGTCKCVLSLIIHCCQIYDGI